MKRIKSMTCLVMCLLMIHISNLSVEAQQVYYEILPDYWFQGVPLGWTGFGANQAVGGSESSYTIEQISSFTNSNEEKITLPDNSYGQQEYNRAAKLSFDKDSVNVRIGPANWWSNNPQISPLIENGYLRVELYFDGTQEQAENMRLYLRNDSYDSSNEVSFAEVFTPMEWSECYIAVKDLINTGFSGGKMKEFRIKTTANFTGNCDIYIHEIGFAKRLNPPELEILETKMHNDTGKFLVKGKFTKKMKQTGANSVQKDYFVLNDCLADEVILDADNQEIQILFDIMPKFPSDITLSISEGMKCEEDGLDFEPTIIEVRTPEIQNEVYSEFCNEPRVEEDKVFYTPFIRFLYSVDNDPQSVTLLTLLYNDGKLINSDICVTEEGDWKEELMPDVSVVIPENTTGVLSLEVYCIDSIESLKPVCEKLVCEQIY